MNFAKQFQDACGMGILAHLRALPCHLLLEFANRGMMRLLQSTFAHRYQ